MRKSFHKIAIAALLLIAGAVVLYSYIYNSPIRFRPKWQFIPSSQRPAHAAGKTPDNVVLAMADDGNAAITITWRTSEAVADGIAQIAAEGTGDAPRYLEYPAKTRELHSPELKSDNLVFCHTVTMHDLPLGTSYRYRVGSAKHDAWSDYATFSLPSGDGDGFTFIYLGDTQSKPAGVGRLLEGADARHPETAFYMIGGDIVDNGDYRNLWDDFLAYTKAVFKRKPVVPVMGNHDFGDHGVYGPRIFSLYFGLPDQVSPAEVRDYSFQYGNAFFVIVNSTDMAVPWLEEQLREADKRGCEYKIVMFHAPVYNPREDRNNEAAKQYYVPLFDKYAVDLVLTGHDHSYLRTKMMRNGKPVQPGETGTTYVVATACAKFHKCQPLDFAEKQIANLATYQRITLGKNKLSYTAHDDRGAVVDAFETSK